MPFFTFLLLVMTFSSVSCVDWGPGESIDGHRALSRSAVGQGDQAGFHRRLVAVRFVDGAELGVGGHAAAAGADRDEGAVAALLPGRERVEAGRRCGAMRFAPAVDVPDRLRGV